MSAVMRYLRPLWVFLSGQLLALLSWVFLPTLAGLAADLWTAAPYDDWWGWYWVVLGLRIIVILFEEILILWNTGRAFLHEE